ncbi:hypothetical protein BX600DRAFT_452045 [Xylariales sp. PMI_506]|nr:hypothetical protein BX600DRAFT_452045 [Xylariales sp. PMI_506]
MKYSLAGFPSIPLPATISQDLEYTQNHCTMESRGNTANESTPGRPAIARRSCDQCRARKVGCDRGSPCSNCFSAKLNCTHSAVAAKNVNPRQRVLISAQYEQKIDEIAKGIDGIKHLLQGLNVTPGVKSMDNGSLLSLVSPAHQKITDIAIEEPDWYFSGHIIGFIKSVVSDADAGHITTEQSNIISSLRHLLQTVERSTSVSDLSFPKTKDVKQQLESSMPPLDAAVAVLRWAKGHETHDRMDWISRVLPLDMFSDICRKVYFAIDDYNDVEFILANGYLSYIFAEYVAETGSQNYLDFSRQCRENLHNSLARLPLLLPPSIEVVAALTLGALNAVESSKFSLAWTFISTASNICQTLGYHHAPSPRDIEAPLQAAQASLFWNVYRMEKALSLRLGRSSTIRDSDVTLSVDPKQSRYTRLAKIQGRVYDQIYSPASSTQTNEYTRGQIAIELATELRHIITETSAVQLESTHQENRDEVNSLMDIYSECELVCQSSLLPLILRAVPPALGGLDGNLNDCVSVARDVLDMHHRCITKIREHKRDPFALNKYLNWSIVHTPYIPFSILFTKAIQFLDHDDLEVLERFAASLRPDKIATESMANPHRLYELLCQAARLYIEANTPSFTTNSTVAASTPSLLNDFDLSRFDMNSETVVDDSLQFHNSQFQGLSAWYLENQQLMNLLDENVAFSS